MDIAKLSINTIYKTLRKSASSKALIVKSAIMYVFINNTLFLFKQHMYFESEYEQLMRQWYLPHRWPVKAQASLLTTAFAVRTYEVWK